MKGCLTLIGLGLLVIFVFYVVASINSGLDNAASARRQEENKQVYKDKEKAFDDEVNKASTFLRSKNYAEARVHYTAALKIETSMDKRLDTTLVNPVRKDLLLTNIMINPNAPIDTIESCAPYYEKELTKVLPETLNNIVNGTFPTNLLFGVTEADERVKPLLLSLAPKEIERRARVAKQQKTAKLAQEKKEAAWNNSKAGRLCKKHPTWSKEDCKNIAENRYWIGMEYDMLVAERGRPNSINPSNYGNGTRYQYCWFNHRPMCFYDNNNDDILDSYN